MKKPYTSNFFLTLIICSLAYLHFCKLSAQNIDLKFLIYQDQIECIKSFDLDAGEHKFNLQTASAGIHFLTATFYNESKTIKMVKGENSQNKTGITFQSSTPQPPKGGECDGSNSPLGDLGVNSHFEDLGVKNNFGEKLDFAIGDTLAITGYWNEKEDIIVHKVTQSGNVSIKFWERLLPFKTIHNSPLTGFFPMYPALANTTHLIKTQEEWEALFAIMGQIYYKPIDFEKEMVIAIFDIINMTHGFRYTVKEIENGVEHLNVKVNKCCGTVFQALCHPFHIITIEKTDKNIEFEFE